MNLTNGNSISAISAQVEDMRSTYEGENPAIHDEIHRGISESPSKHKITIEPLDYGYLVSVGCQKLAVESSEKLVKKLGEYLANPGEVQGKWFSTDKQFMI